MIETYGFSELGYKIFADRYSLKSDLFNIGDTVVFTENDGVTISTGVVLEKSRYTVNIQTGGYDDTDHVIVPTNDVKQILEIPNEMFKRVAENVACAEEDKRSDWATRFYIIMRDLRFIPGGRILSAAGRDGWTYYNCFVLPSPGDSRNELIVTLRDMINTMSKGGGVGINISSIRPTGSPVYGISGYSSGAVSWGALYNFATGLISQGGCLIPETLVYTANGTLQLSELVHADKHEWRANEVLIATDSGYEISLQGFNNGMADTITLQTEAGINLTGTPNHKVQILTESGLEWCRLDELQPNVPVVFCLNKHEGQQQSLLKPNLTHFNQKEVTLPEVLDENTAFFLGYFAGNGFMGQPDGDFRVGVSVPHKSYLVEEMPKILKRLFNGVHVTTQQKPDDASVTYVMSIKLIHEWLTINQLNKRSSNTIEIPLLIRKSSRKVVGAYLRGIFEADGALCHGYPMLSSTSEKFVREIATLLIGLGCPVRIIKQTSRDDCFGSKPIWEVKICSTHGLRSWCDNIGCDIKSRFAVSLDFTPDMRESSYELPYPKYWVKPVLEAITKPPTRENTKKKRFKSANPKLRRKLLRYLRGDRCFTKSAFDNLSKDYDEFKLNARIVKDYWFSRVSEITASKNSLTLDLEVANSHSYIANGMVTHNSRRGALGLVMDDWHPDVLEFVTAKREEKGKFDNTNISVAISDDLVDAVAKDLDWSLVFPDIQHSEYDMKWNGDLHSWLSAGLPVKTHQVIKARELWDAIVNSAWINGEPGVWFVDKTNEMSNSHYLGRLRCTNPCFEEPLPDWGACCLGSLNLPKFVAADMTTMNWEELRETINLAVRFLDDVVDVTPDSDNMDCQKTQRRIGLGTMGLAELLILVGLKYGSAESLVFIERLYEFIAVSTYTASANLAAEKGACSAYNADDFLESGFMKQMPDATRDFVRLKGMRNMTVLTQAPTGTIATMVSTSTGIEPFFDFRCTRKSRLGEDEEHVKIYDDWQKINSSEPLPEYFVTTHDISANEHIMVQAIIQRWIDASISKTVNLPNNATKDDVANVFLKLYESGCKGGTVYRDGSRKEQVLNKQVEQSTAVTLPLSEVGKPAIAEGACVRELLSKRHGVTVSMKTPSGTAHITMNNDDSGQPFEVFVEIGKAGSSIKAMAEAIGRLISLCLRITPECPTLSRAAFISEQLSGIGGRTNIGFGKAKVKSLPDAIGKVIEETWLAENNAAIELKPENLSDNKDICPVCGHATLTASEGCFHCIFCSYSEC